MLQFMVVNGTGKMGLALILGLDCALAIRNYLGLATSIIAIMFGSIMVRLIISHIGVILGKN